MRRTVDAAFVAVVLFVLGVAYSVSPEGRARSHAMARKRYADRVWRGMLERRLRAARAHGDA
jgi:hypothetical protein